MHVYYQRSVWSAHLERSAWNDIRSSLSRPRMYTISDQCGQWIGSTPREMVLAPFLSIPSMCTINGQCGQRIGSSPCGMVRALREVDHECRLAVISVVSE